mmetsp:Transcript_33618/g.63002  ORF Transcript_33618/g.63002 Transcript_33618/m.63002 type:complete len:252 (+) Transcript_33618:54-809(+)
MEESSKPTRRALVVAGGSAALAATVAVAWYLRRKQRQRRLEQVLDAIDAINVGDPRMDELQEGEVVEKAGSGSASQRPKEWLYGKRMSRRLNIFSPNCSDVVKVAARAQHVKRWVSERASYPEGTAGYKQWRQELAKMHGKIASEEMLKAGFPEKEAKRVVTLLTKKDIKKDAEVQLLEDVICLVFIEFYWIPFSKKHVTEPGKDAMGEEKLLDIVRKTWVKMSDAGHQAALQLPLAEGPKALIVKALQGA